MFLKLYSTATLNPKFKNAHSVGLIVNNRYVNNIYLHLHETLRNVFANVYKNI